MPVNLLRAGRIFVFEPPPGVKANMLRTFSSIPVSRICKVRVLSPGALDLESVRDTESRH